MLIDIFLGWKLWKASGTGHCIDITLNLLHRIMLPLFLLLIIQLMVSLHYSGSFVCLFGYPENIRVFVFLLNQSNVNIFLVMMMMMMMMMMKMMNCLCGMVDQRKPFSLISRTDYCQRFSPSQISDTPRAGSLVLKLHDLP